MNVRKQILVALLATVAVPLAASAATPEEWYAPLSTWQTIEKGATSSSAADDAGVANSYPLLSYSAEPKQETVETGESVSSAASDPGKATSYALSSYGAGQDRG